MGIRRAAYMIALAGALLFYILYPYWFSWYLLVLILLLIPFDLFASLPGMLTRRLKLSSPDVLGQGEDGFLTATTECKVRFPVRCVIARLKITCDDYSLSRRIECGAERGGGYELIIDTSRTGVTAFKVRRAWVVSLLGLFSVPIPAGCEAAVLVLPAPVKPPREITLPRGVTLRPKPGGGFADDADLRPYRIGDPVRTIHWKLSAKHDSLIVREPLAPPRHSRLVRVAMWDSPGGRDLTLGRLLWISGRLLKNDLSYYVKLGDSGPIAEVAIAKDLEDYLFHVLSGAPGLPSSAARLPSRFSWVLRIDSSEET